MNDLPVIDDTKDQYFDTTFAANFLNSKLAELGDYSQKYTRAKVVGLAKDKKIEFKQSATRKPYEFTLPWLSEYIQREYIDKKPSINDLLSEIPNPRSQKQQDLVMNAGSAQSNFLLKSHVESHPLKYVAGVAMASFLAGIAALTFIFPEIKSRLALHHINLSDLDSPESIKTIERILNDQVSESELGRVINDMAVSGNGVFSDLDYSDNNQLLNKIKQLKTEDPYEIEPFRQLVKAGVGPFHPIDRKVNLKLVYPEEVEDNAILGKVKDSLAATCPNAFEHKSAINITARAINAQDTSLLGMKAVYAHISYRYDECPESYEEPTTIWVDATYLSSLFSGGSAPYDKIKDVAVTVELNASFQLPNSY